MGLASRLSLFSLEQNFTFFTTFTHFSVSDLTTVIFFPCSLFFSFSHHSDGPPLDHLQLLHIFLVSTNAHTALADASPVRRRALPSCTDSPKWRSPFLHQPSIVAFCSICVLGCLLNIFPQNCCENSSSLSCVSAAPRSCLNVALIHVECYPHFSDHICTLSRSLNYNLGF